jgi:hypothetical protein
MSSVRFDVETADRLLMGAVDPADVPAGFEAVALLLESARPAASRPVYASCSVPSQVDSQLVTQPLQRRRSMLATPPFKVRLSVLAAAAALCGMTGAAYASGLPSAASETASAVLQQLGISTPGPNSHANTRPASVPATGDAVSTLAKATTATGVDKGAVISAMASGGKSRAGENSGGSGRAGATGDEGAGSAGQGKGAVISTLAKTTTATGVDKGATISTAASGGKSQAGQHGGASGQAGGVAGGGAGAGSSHGQGGDHSTNAGGNGHGPSGTSGARPGA